MAKQKGLAKKHRDQSSTNERLNTLVQDDLGQEDPVKIVNNNKQLKRLENKKRKSKAASMLSTGDTMITRSVASYFNAATASNIPIDQRQNSEPENLSQSQEGGEGGRDATDAYQRGDLPSDLPNGGLPGRPSADGTGNGSESPEPSSNARRTDDPISDPPNGGLPGQPPVDINQAEGNERPSHSVSADPEVIYLRNANLKLINQLKNCESVMDKLKKESTSQKKMIKKLSDKSDTLQKKLSKFTGIRKYTETQKDNSSSPKTNTNVNSSPSNINTSDADKQKTTRRRQKFRPANINVKYTGAGTSEINVSATQNSTRYTPNTSTILWGTSLVHGMGSELRDRGIEATSVSYPGGKTEFMKNSANKAFAGLKTKPANIVVQTAGNCCDDFKISTEKIIENYETIIQEIRNASPSSRIICSSIPPRRDNPWVNLRIKQVNDYLRTRGELKIDNVLFIDVVPKNMKTMFRQDKVHFNAKGKAEYIYEV